MDMMIETSTMAKASTDNPPSLLDEWGIRIAIARAALGIQQNELAESTGVGYKTLSNWERGHAPPDQRFLVKFHAIYGIDPNYILLGRMDSLPSQVREKIQKLTANRWG